MISVMWPARCVRRAGRLDGLVHTAATLGSLGPIEHQSLEAWQTVLRVNLAAAMALTRSLRPLLIEAADAAIVFTLDTRAHDPRAYWGAYGASKAGLAALAATLADESDQQPNLRVSAVVPGPMRSPMRTLTHPGEDKRAHPLPESLVPLYLYLLGGQAKPESGSCLDGAAWLAGREAVTVLVGSDHDHAAASPEAGGRHRPAACRAGRESPRTASSASSRWALRQPRPAS